MRTPGICTEAFVGRDGELAALRRLATGPGAETDVVLVDGEPGIGRTRFLTEVSRVTRESGLATLVGTAATVEPPTPYGLLTDILAGVAEGPQLARIMAGIDRSTVDATKPRLPSHHDRLGRDLVHLVAELPGRGTAILVDDIHLADHESIALLGYLLRHRPARRVLVVVSYRHGRCPPDLVPALSPGRCPIHITLPALCEVDVQRWWATIAGDRMRQLITAGGGNPGYLVALADAPDATLAAIGRGECPDRPLLGAGAEAFTAEIRRLPAALYPVLYAAAVIGCDVGVAGIAHVADAPGPQVEDAVDALADRDLLRVGVEYIDFRHPLVRAAAYWRAGPAWRVRAHARAAAFLRARGAPLARVAPHLALSAPLGDVPSAKALAVAAGEAMGSAPAVSLTWLRAAERILPDHDDPGRQTMRGRALVLSGQFARGTAVLRAVAGQAGPHRATAVEHFAQLERLLGRYSQARALLSTELPAAGGGHTQAMLRLELAASELFEARYGPAGGHARAALSIARRDGHPGIEAAAAAVVAACALGTLPLPRAVDRIDRAQALFDRLPDTGLREELGGFALLSWGQYVTGRRATATANVHRALRVARDYGRHHALPQLLMVRSELWLAAGRVGEAVRDADEAGALAESAGSTELRVIATSMGLRPRLWQAGTECVRDILAELHRQGGPASSWFRVETAVVLAEVHLILGECALGASALAGIEAVGLRTGGPPAATVLTLRARTTGAPGRADELLAEAEQAAAGLPFYRAQVFAARAARAIGDGHTARAVELADAATKDYAAAGVPLWEGQARMRLAEALGGAGDIGAARRELGTAKSLFADGGARWLATRCGRVQRQLSARLPRGSSNGALTSRELQVAALVTAGLTNAAIARELVLSDRTVETHLARIFGRLGVRSRAAVASWYTTSALTEHPSGPLSDSPDVKGPSTTTS